MDASRLKAIPLFANLSNKHMEQVARHADEVEVKAGTVLIHKGDGAHEFIAIEQGTATVSRDGKVIRTLGPGEFFGEIGLLRTHYRTADVIADTDMKLVVIFGPEFVVLDEDIKEMREAVEAAIATRLATGQG
ncbi:MAG TPA: cyclic nucleotide-binding domain-containing protein [Acidimicrobiia bacterium]|jgi:CRP-like cAMP-binding protein